MHLSSACGNAAATSSQSNIVSDSVSVPEFDGAVDEDKLVILCDPARFRLSIRAKADAESVDTSYSRRVLIDPYRLVELFPNHGGGNQYQRSLVRYERCGPLVVGLRGAFLNSNLDGEMGAIPAFAAVTLSADNRQIFPEERTSVGLADCDTEIPRWGDCPEGYAVRIDFDYVPNADPFDGDADELHIHEWVRSGDIIGAGELRTSERRSSVNPGLGLWWISRR